MYQRFNQFKESRDLFDFGVQYEFLCEGIAESGITFEQFWLEHGLPIITQGTCENEDQLIAEFLGSLGKKIGGWFGGGQPERPALSNDTQAKAYAAMNDIKQAFNRAMQVVINKYKQDKDGVGYQLAQAFLDKVNAYAEKLKVVKGEGQFDRTSAFGTNKWQDMAASPTGRQNMVTTYSQKLGVSPDVINRLIDAGYTNPSLWPGMIQQWKNSQQSSVQGGQQATLQGQPNAGMHQPMGV